MLVERLRLEAFLRTRTDDDRRHVSTAMLQIGEVPFIEGDDQQAAALERGIRDQWRNISLQPGVSLRQRAVVSIIQSVRRNERILRQRIVPEIGGELRKGH